MSGQKLSPSESLELLKKMTEEYDALIKAGASKTTPNRRYILKSNSDIDSDKQSARKKAILALSNKNTLKKVAFDTRKIDQQNQRNPRANLQYWHRADPFVSQEEHDKVKIFSKLKPVLDNIKKSYGTYPEYHNSYVRQLDEQINRLVRLRTQDQEVFGPQLAYIEQLVFSRYRLTPENIVKSSSEELNNILMSRDEPLIRRGDYLHETNDPNQEQIKNSNVEYKTGDGNANLGGVLNQLFGGQIRHAGEKNVERTITIKIVDEVK